LPENREDYIMIKYVYIIAGVMITLAAAAVFRQLLTEDSQRTNMAFSAQNSIPVIDKQNAAQVDTATFALG
jgi:hypothetical protein